MDTINQNPQHRAPNELGGDNRPRLRKIKRPKQHNGPIQNHPRPAENSGFTTSNFREQNTLKSDNAFQRNFSSNSGTNLVSASDNAVYNQRNNNFNTPDYITGISDDDVFEYHEPVASVQNTFDNKKVI